jgi:cytochrome c-type biogenesis protein
MDNPGIFLAFGAGLLSFLTPCCLPIFPSFLSYVTGVSIDKLEAGNNRGVRLRILQHSFAFFIGFSSIYMAMGLVSSALGSFFTWGRCMFRLFDTCLGLHTLGGFFVILMGLALLGVIRIPMLMREHRLRLANRPAGFFGSVLIGLTFAAGWTPCTGPILGAVLTLAARSPGQGVLLLFVYSLGFALPFTALAYSLGSAKVLAKYSHQVERIGGGLMIFMGLMLATGTMARLSAWLIEVTGFQGF